MRFLNPLLLGSAALGLISLTAPASATVAETFTLDSMSILKCVGTPCSDTLIYQNGFDGSFSGAATPSTVPYTNAAPSSWGATAGSTFSENRSRLTLGGDQSVVVTSSISGRELLTNQAQLQTPKFSDRNALGKGRDFAVATVWDLSAPLNDLSRYGVRLNDQNSSSPLPTDNNDILDVSVVNHGGLVYIEVRDLLADGTPAGDNVLAQVPLDLLGGFDQVALALTWDTLNSLAGAAFVYGNSGSFDLTTASWTSLGSWQGVLFSDDSYTRARIYASSALVPAPQLLALFGTGLLLLGSRIRRRRD